MIPPELLGMGLPELLTVYYGGKVSKSSLEWISNKVKEILAQKRYGFTPEPKIATELQQITKSDAYRRTKECIGNNPLLNVIRLGLRMEKLTEEGKSEAIRDMKNNVIRKYGPDGITILNMGATGALIPIIEHLSDMKIETDYDQIHVLDYFKKVVESWSNITIFHQTEHGKDALVEKIKHYMDAHLEIFFIFSIGSAGEQAKKAISTLNNNGIIQTKGYMFTLISRKEDQKGRDHFSWIFKNIYTFDKIIL